VALAVPKVPENPRSVAALRYFDRPGAIIPVTSVPVRQDALQRAPVYVEPARGLGDVAAAQLVDALDVLPAHPIGRHRVLRRIGLAAVGREQRIDDVVGVGRLCKVVDRAELHGVDHGRDIAVAGQHDPAGVGAPSPPSRDKGVQIVLAAR
jgi:hypothetical protein